MSNLDNTDHIKEIDKGNVLGSVEALADQCKDAWDQASQISIPDEYKNTKNIVMCGMGGSGLGARVVESVYSGDIDIPITRVNDYNLPNFVDENSLVICSSYSGSTEETLENAKQAVEKKAKWMAIGTGGELIDLAKRENAPYYQIDPRYNPSNQPRMAIGYSVVGQLSLVSKAEIFDFEDEDIRRAVEAMNEVSSRVRVEIPTEENDAKLLAHKLLNKNIFYISSEHLVGATHTVNNQLNENAKAFSADFQIPELNHHLMEGLKHPSNNDDNLFMLFIDSRIYSDRIRKRFQVTADVVAQNDIENHVYTPTSQTKLSQAFELIQFGAYVNFYLSILYGQNPAPIPWVDYFKEKMKG